MSEPDFKKDAEMIQKAINSGLDPELVADAYINAPQYEVVGRVAFISRETGLCPICRQNYGIKYPVPDHAHCTNCKSIFFKKNSEWWEVREVDSKKDK